MGNAGGGGVVDESQAGIKIAGRNISNLRYGNDTTLMAETEEDLKSFLMKVKEESEKAGLKHNIQNTKIMASGPITSRQIHGETMADFIFWGSKITADATAALKLKDTLKKSYGKKEKKRKEKLWQTRVLKSRDITFSIKVYIVKTMVFPVVMYGCENWTIKKAEC